MTSRTHGKAAQRKRAPRPTGEHPHSIATIAPEGDAGRLPDQPFVEGAQDELDPDLRHRLISAAAFHHLAERGYDESYDRDDWLEAEAAVDHIIVNTSPGEG